MVRASLIAAFLAIAMLQAASARAACQVGKLAELPVTMSGTRPLIPAKINGEEAMFLADSGAFFSMLTPAAAAQFHLRVGGLGGMRVSGVGGEANNAGLTTAKSFNLAGSTSRTRISSSPATV